MSTGHPEITKEQNKDCKTSPAQLKPDRFALIGTWISFLREGKCFFFLVFFGGLNLLGFFIALAGSLKASNSSSLEFPVLNLIFPRHKK